MTALDCAPRHDVVHRDIEPENILLHEGHAIVADFGIGKAIAAAAETVSRLLARYAADRHATGVQVLVALRNSPTPPGGFVATGRVTAQAAQSRSASSRLPT